MTKTEKRSRAVVCGALSLALAASYMFFSESCGVNADKSQTVKGDVNGDGVISSADAVSMINYLLGKDEKITNENADMNGDGNVNIIDAVLLAEKLVNPAASPSEKPSDTPPAEPSEKPSDTPSEKPSSDPEKTETMITLNGDSVKTEGSGVKAEGSVVTVTEPGIYVITGKLDNGQIIVDVDKEKYPEGKVELSLEGAEITSADNSPVYIASVADECVITAKKGTENIISDGKNEYTNADGGSGAVYSKDDLKIKGKGSLTVNGNYRDGIVSKDSVKIFNGNITVNAADDGIRGKDSVKIGDSDETDFSGLVLTVNSSDGDGIRATNDTDEDKGKVIINGGTVRIKAFGDGIQGVSDVKIAGGDIDIYTYEGSSYTASGSQTGGTENQQPGGWGGRPGGNRPGGGGFGMDGNANKMPDDLSAKAVKSAGTINITGGNITIDSSDDAIHGAGNVTITGGRLSIKSADDAVHSDADLVIGAGTSTTYDDVMIYVSKCYEGIEAKNITQNSGTVLVYADDDGYNAAGGADGSGNAGPGGWMQGGGFGRGGGDYSLNLKGGFAFVSSADGDHDGFDSNGSITVDGAIAVSNGNEAFDCDGTKTFSSGTFIELSGGNGGGFGMPGGAEVGWDTSFSSSVTAQKGSRITVTDDKGNLIVSFLAGKPASKVSVGSKTAASGKITVSEEIPAGKALPVTGDSQQVYVAE